MDVSTKLFEKVMSMYPDATKIRTCFDLGSVLVIG